MPYIPHTDDDVRHMLATIGVDSVDDLFADIHASLRPASFDLPAGLSEREVKSRLSELADRNASSVTSFLGCGFYDHYIPDAVDALIGRGEFYTAYTPYQPEASQGTLQAIFEFQTAVCRLFGMECANGSVYDAGTAIFEAVMMAVRARKKKRIVVSETVNPIYRTMLGSYTANLHLELVTVPHTDGATDVDALMAAIDGETACVVVQNPDFFGNIADFTKLFEHAHTHKALGIISTYPVMASLLKTPGDMGADIAVAEGQSLGLPLSFGGPYLGIMTCTKKLVRQMPGRMVGRTTDTEGRPGYVLTLQAREQHIRRSRATSNICSNQALCALRSLVHMCLLGEKGLADTATLCVERAHYAATRLAQIDGVRVVNPGPFANEFVIELPQPAAAVAGRMASSTAGPGGHGIVPGFPLCRYFEGMDNRLLVAVTEKHDRRTIGMLAEELDHELARGGA